MIASTLKSVSLHWRDYLELTKPKVVALLVFTSMVGMLLASPGWVALDVLILGNLGIGLAAAGAAAINHLVDRHIDQLMARTQNRPLPTGGLNVRETLFFALLLSCLGLWILAQFINMLTAILTFFSLIMYAVVYTLYLKRATPQNIVIGGAAGAAPPLLGWVAVTNSIDPNALLLFLIIFTWTPPHFWALAVARHKEYAKADIPMLPVTHGIQYTKWQSFFYTILLSLITVLPYLTGFFTEFYLFSALLLNGIFLWLNIRMLRSDSMALAMKTFGYSIVYLSVLFAVMLVDHYLEGMIRMIV